jgi:hypothetical protein
MRGSAYDTWGGEKPRTQKSAWKGGYMNLLNAEHISKSIKSDLVVFM